MTVDDFPQADLASFQELKENQWILLAIFQNPRGKEKLDKLLPGDREDLSNYEVFRVDASADETAAAFLQARELDQTDQFVILSNYRGSISTWCLDELEWRDPEDLLQLMDDHAGYIELEDEDFL